MNLLAVGCSFHHTPVELRERLGFDGSRLEEVLDELGGRFGCEVVILNTCNRVEIYLAHIDAAAGFDGGQVAEVLATANGLPVEMIRDHIYEHEGIAAVSHLFRVASSLDSLVLGEGQIAAQVREAYEKTKARGHAGPVLNALCQHALRVAKRVRTETGIAQGKVSVASVAVDFVRQVFSHFNDKTILIIGAGKMGELTLRHLKALEPKQILVTNRSPEKAMTVAGDYGGQAVPWERLDDALASADIVLSTTGAPEPIVSLRRYQQILARRTNHSVVILDIAVPRDFDPAIHDGDRTCLFNIDDLSRICDETIAERRKHLERANAIIIEETQGYCKNLARRRHSPVIARLTEDFMSKRQAILRQLFAKLEGTLSESDKEYIEGAFCLLQNQILYGPISALSEEAVEGQLMSRRHTLPDALCRLFRLQNGQLTRTTADDCVQPVEREVVRASR
jgi:glutamyl-tRNA reductase